MTIGVEKKYLASKKGEKPLEGKRKKLEGDRNRKVFGRNDPFI